MEDKIKLFLVEDHKIVRDGLRALLFGEKRIQIIGEAANGAAFFNALPNLSPNIVILDIGLPDISGLEIAKRLYKEYQDIKIVILTASFNEENLVEALKYDVAGFLTKDTSKDEFLEAIFSIIKEGQFFSNEVSKIILKKFTKNLNPLNKNEDKLLTKRETQIIELIADGNSYKEIADKLFISIRTVETHRNNIIEKLKLRNNIEIVKYAIKNNLIKLD